MSASRIFIGGSERSGTTLMASLLADATGLLYLPESSFFIRALSDHDHGAHGRSSMLHDWRVKMWGTDFAEGVGTLDERLPPAQLFDDMVRLYAETRGELDKYERGWMEHTPATIKAVSLIQRQIPVAKHIHVVRDPRAVTASLLAVDFGSATSTTAAEQWKCSVLDGVLAEMNFPDQVVRVHYEDLVADPRAVTEKAAAELSLPIEGIWQPAGREVDPFFQRHEALIGQAPTEDRVAAWRSELSKRQVAAVEAVAENALQILGYKLVGAQNAYPRWGPYVDRLADGPGRLIGLARRHSGRLWRKAHSLRSKG